jgi:Fe-S-cluster containining protein
MIDCKETLGIEPAGENLSAVCRACGACCAFSAEWPRFALEDDAALDRIPVAFVDRERGRMRCAGDRCAALTGEVGVATSCAAYAVRPDVCRDCLPGDAACQMARRRFGLAPLPGRCGDDPLVGGIASMQSGTGGNVS